MSNPPISGAAAPAVAPVADTPVGAPAVVPPLGTRAALGVSAETSTSAVHGLSVKHGILGKNVYNDAPESEHVGDIADVLLGADGQVSYTVVNASKFLGLSSHYVLIPIGQLKFEEDRAILPGSTKDALRELPQFEYNQ